MAAGVGELAAVLQGGVGAVGDRRLKGAERSLSGPRRRRRRRRRVSRVAGEFPSLRKGCRCRTDLKKKKKLWGLELKIGGCEDASLTVKK